MAVLKPIQFVICLALTAFASLSAEEQDKLSEYQVKAQYLFYFAEFITWPATAFSQPDQPFVIGIFGDDPFGRYLDDVVRGEKIGNRPIVVRRYGKVEDAVGCHVLYVGRISDGLLELVLSGVKNKPTLIVGEAEDFFQLGGMIRFSINQEDKVRFTIKQEAAKAAKLEISYKLLKLAEVLPAAKG